MIRNGGQVVYETKGDTLVVRVGGEIDHHSAPGIREEIDGYLERNRPKKLIMDLGGTSFMDSSGLGLILGRLRKTQEMKMEMVLANPSVSVLRILQLAGVEKLLSIQYL